MSGVAGAVIVGVEAVVAGKAAHMALKGIAGVEEVPVVPLRTQRSTVPLAWGW